MNDIVIENKQNIDIIGIDIKDGGLVISWLSDDMNDPSTFSHEDGENSLVFPLSISKAVGLGRWYIGFEADLKANKDGAHRVSDLYNKAINKETVAIEGREYSYEELFATYLRRIIEENGFELSVIKKLVVTIPEVDERSVELFSMLNSRLTFKKDVLTLIDHKEAFIYYTLSQNQNIYTHDVALFEYDKGRILSYLLSRNTGTRPQIIDIAIDKADIFDADGEGKDREFLSLIERVVKDRVITSVFLIGDGFDPEWMKESVNLLCKGRRVFMGDNLYSKGACFAGRIRLGKRPWNFVYIGDHEMKMNLSLKVNDRNDMSFFSLVEAGENWYETGRECEVILDGNPEFECWIQSPETRRAKIQMIELNKMPKRENRTTRLRISANPISDTKVIVKIRDLGFGDIAPGSGRVWEHLVDFNGEDEIDG